MFYKRNRLPYVILIIVLLCQLSYADQESQPFIDQKEYRSNQSCKQAQTIFDEAGTTLGPGSRYRACASLKSLSINQFGGEMIDYAGPIKFDTINNRKNCLKPDKPYCRVCDNWKKQQKEIQDFCDTVCDQVKWKLFEALRYVSGCDHPTHELRRNRLKKVIETEMATIETNMTTLNEFFKLEVNQIKIQVAKCKSK
jgi:hypothetical protein